MKFKQMDFEKLISKSIEFGAGKEKDFYEILSSNLDFANAFGTTIAKKYGVKTFMEVDEISSFYGDIIKEYWNKLTPQEIIDLAHKNYELNTIDVYTILPLDVPKSIFKKSGVIRQQKLFGHDLLPASITENKFLKVMKKNIPGFEIGPNPHLLKHFSKKSFDALLSRDLLLIRKKGTYQSVKHSVSIDMEAIRQTIELAANETEIFSLGSNSGNSLSIEYRPRSNEFQYHWVREISNIKFELSKNLLDILKSKDSAARLDVLRTEDENSLRKRIKKSVRLFCRGFNEGDNLNKFIFFIIALESLFSRDKQTPIRATLADYVSIILGKGEEKMAIHKSIRDIYDIRSAIFHSGEEFVPEKSVKELQELTSRSLRWVIDNFGKQRISTENRLFEYLLKKKLSLEK
jgi:hypothetical protein